MSVATETLPLTVDNTGFLLDKLGEDCHPLQFLRELTQNSIEAIQRSSAGQGEIVWDVDWLPFELGEHSAFKLSVTDNGDGMTGDEMVRFINQLSSSVSIQSPDGNYGVGAKIAAATRNHAGMVYLSWKDGEGAMIHLWRDPRTGTYGLHQIEMPDGSFGHSAPIEDEVKPEFIQEHGTKIILYGMTEDADTMKAPPEAASPSKWIAKYLNSRYFRFPDGIVVKAREGWEQPRANTDVNTLRTLICQQKYVESHKQSSGTVSLTNATAHWWILKDEKAIGSNSGFIESAGHIAALYKNELYEMSTGRSGHALLQQFGIIFGHRRVVIYVEPQCVERLTTNTARTHLLLNSLPLQWSEWAAEFRERLPGEIDELMNQIASQSQRADHGKSIRERLKSVFKLFNVSRYRPTADGELQIGDPQAGAGGGVSGQRSTSAAARGGGGQNKKGGIIGGVYSTFLKKDGARGSNTKPDPYPKVNWVSVTDGTREKGDIEDRAARFLADQNRLLVNADFRVFTDMIEFFAKEYAKQHHNLPGVTERIAESVRSWYEQALVETVIGLQALKGSREWSVREINSALSDEALTAVVMQRYHAFNSVKRELGTAIASLKSA